MKLKFWRPLKRVIKPLEEINSRAIFDSNEKRILTHSVINKGGFIGIRRSTYCTLITWYSYCTMHFGYLKRIVPHNWSSPRINSSIKVPIHILTVIQCYVYVGWMMFVRGPFSSDALEKPGRLYKIEQDQYQYSSSFSLLEKYFFPSCIKWG